MAAVQSPPAVLEGQRRHIGQDSVAPRKRRAVEQILNPRVRPQWDFGFSKFLRDEHRFGLDSDRPVCRPFLQGHCPLGDKCPDRHTSSNNYNNVICKHWLRGLCKKGAACEFSHEYNLRGMPECVSYSRHLTCPNGADCLYLHLDPDQKAPPCEHYERGFCPLGPFCAARHVKRKTICRFWMAGFCPNGKDCNEGGHPRWREKEELKRPEVKVVLSEEEKETERERLRAKMEREREEEERPPYLDKAGQQNQHRQQGRSRGRKNWNRQRRDRY